MAMEYGVLFLLILFAGLGLIVRVVFFLRQISAPARGSEGGFRQTGSNHAPMTGGTE